MEPPLETADDPRGAKRVGVSKSLVSLDMRGPGRVGDVGREAALQAADELGYFLSLLPPQGEVPSLRGDGGVPGPAQPEPDPCEGKEERRGSFFASPLMGWQRAKRV
ncbi:MAG TPA: LacI family DNA-binding transcriptional regulator [Actinobacteria bacterium]|nr:hypothetical protein BMS3Bbin01_01145 [bacterium BMS3Bbin01]HDH26057.1 LacI family DNA-binding transcriptional regulator [Actinomycetota bacterium]